MFTTKMNPASMTTIVALVITSVLVYSGCVDLPSQQPQKVQFFASGVGGSSTNDLIGVVMAYKNNADIIDSNGTNSFQQSTVQAQFADSNAEFPVYAGTVQFNSTPLTAGSDTAAYQYTLDGASLSFSSTMNHFTIAGSSDFPAISDSVLSPTNETTIGYPSIGDTVSKSNGFTIRWNSDAADTVLIIVNPPPGVSGSTNVVALVPNTGTYSVGSGSMSGWITGKCSVSVSRINFVRRTVPGTSRDVLFTVESQHDVDCWLSN